MKKIALLVSSLMLASTVSAAPVTSWDYTASLEFTAASFVDGNEPGDTSSFATADGDAYFTDKMTLNYSGDGSQTFQADEISWGDNVANAYFDNSTDQQVASDGSEGGTFVSGGGTFYTYVDGVAVPSDGGRSALTIGDATDLIPKLGETDVSGTTVDLDSDTLLGYGNSLTHWNNVIWSNQGRVSTGQLTDNLIITPTGGGTSITLPTITFDFRFAETPNAGTNGLCANGDVANQQSNGAGCQDLWGFTVRDISTEAGLLAALENFDETGIIDLGDVKIDMSSASAGVQFNSLDSITFQLDGYIYEVGIVAMLQDLNSVADPADDPSLFTSLLENTLDPGECAALGFDQTTCIGFKTEEVVDTSARFGFTISKVSEVPLPGAVWLFGTALLGFGGYSRMKKSKKA